MTTQKKSLISVIQISMYSFLLLLVLVIGALWLNEEIKRSQIHKDEIRETFLTSQKTTLKSEVGHVVKYIEHKRELLENRVKEEVENRTEEAYQTALYIYNTNRYTKSRDEIGKLIHDALYAASWNDGKGYYFVEDMQGTELVNRNNPELEGQNILNLQDKNGKFLVQEILAVANSEEKEGFCTYYWNLPENPGVLVPKLSYVKYFEPLDWVIGNGMYFVDEEKRIKQEVLNRLTKVTFDNERYIFIGTWEGRTLLGPGKGRNMWDATDSNGVKIVQDLIKKAKEGGGFVNYVMPKIEGNRPSPKMAYSAPVNTWEWYVGTGSYIDYIEEKIIRQQEQFNKTVQKIIFQTIFVLALFLSLSLLFAWLFSRQVKKNFQIFLDFFKKSALERVPISTERVSFSEFQSLAHSANQMVEDRRKAWAKLNAEQERLAVTLQSIGDGVITTDTKGNVRSLNKVAEELTGWSNVDATGRSASEVYTIIDREGSEKHKNPILKILALGRKVAIDAHATLQAKDGKKRSIADSGAPIRDSHGKIIGVVLVFRDISNEKKMEEEFLKIRKLESIGVLAGGIAHDFNNILSAILGNIELVSFRIKESDPTAATLLYDAQKATKRAAKLTGQLLTFSKGGQPVKEETALPELITDSANFVLHGSTVVCRYLFPDNLWSVDVDSGQISQVIQNIIINSKHAMPEGGAIVITCENVQDAAAEPFLSADTGDYVRITIEDSGCGIPQEFMHKIFDPYFTTKQEGSGLGLAICHSIISKHEGFLTVDSTLGKGSTFTLFLPALSLTNITAANPLGPEQAVTSARIMVMEDEEMLRELTRAQLITLGHEAVLVKDGMEAIEKYQKLQEDGTPVDLIIMDLTIPGGMGGQEAAEKLLQIFPDVKIIVASGYSNDPVMANFSDYGFMLALAKPFDINQLNETLVNILSQKK